MSVATFYRGLNIISDDVASMPFQQFVIEGGKINKVDPNPITRNMAYLLQVSPNAWGWTPFQFKKAILQWKICYGNAYVWRPPVSPPQLFILPANRTAPMYDLQGNLWYQHRFSNGGTAYIPSVEIFHQLINPDETGIMGRGVITFARETLGQQIGSRKTKSKLYSQGLTAAAYIQMDAALDKQGRDDIRREYAQSMSGSDNAYSLAVLDKKVTKFEKSNSSPKEAQYFESKERNNADIWNFLGLSRHLLNNGK